VTAGSTVRAGLEALLRAGLAAADAGAAVARHVVRGAGGLALAGRPVPDGARFVVVAAGKAAVPMAAALEAAAGERVERGLAVTKDGHGAPLGRIDLRETAHPVPDARCEAAAREILRLAASGRPGEELVVLLSGGASALLACPAEGLSLEDLAATTSVLLASGADIGEVNAVRKHLSDLAGGRLARAWTGGPVTVLALSDVPGDRLDVIGSGPCSADPTRFEDAVGVLRRRDLLARVPPAVRAHLEAGARGEREETPGPDDPVLARVRAHVVASNATALAAMARAAASRGLRASVDPEPLVGEARDAAGALLRRAEAAAGGEPLVWLAGGETTVTLGDSPGLGGRNQELALAAALALAGDPGRAILAAGTDGTDGPTDAAGAFADGGTVARGAARGVDAGAALAGHDAYRFFETEGGLLRTGPTGTNVMDVALVAVRP
jgi:glycerate-2-kinase